MKNATNTTAASVAAPVTTANPRLLLRPYHHADHEPSHRDAGEARHHHKAQMQEDDNRVVEEVQQRLVGLPAEAREGRAQPLARAVALAFARCRVRAAHARSLAPVERRFKRPSRRRYPPYPPPRSRLSARRRDSSASPPRDAPSGHP